MKKLFLTFASFALLAVSCSDDDDIPVDVHEHEEANKMILSYTEEGTTVENVVEFNVGTGTTGAIDLENGKIYDVEVSFYHDDENLTPEIIEEIDEHFMNYLFADMDVVITRTASDPVRTDGNKLGIDMKWTVNSTPIASSSVNVQLIHTPDSVDDSANNGAGSYQGGEPDVDVNFVIE